MTRPLARSSRVVRVSSAPAVDGVTSTQPAPLGGAAPWPPNSSPPGTSPLEVRDSLRGYAPSAAATIPTARLWGRTLGLLAGLAGCPACQQRPAALSGLCDPCAASLRRAVAALPAPSGDRAWLGPHAGVWKRLVHALKYRGSWRLARFLGELMAVRLDASDYRPQLVTHVPTSPVRRRQRSYDQAELLARTVASASGLPHVTALVRTRATHKQAGTGRAAREANVAGAFRSRYLADRRVLLVDDVLTTGATLASASAALAAANAAEVRCLLVARAAPHDSASSSEERPLLP